MTIRPVIGVLVAVLLLAIASIAYLVAHHAPSSNSVPRTGRAVSTSMSKTITNTTTRLVAGKTTIAMQEGLAPPIYQHLGYPTIHYYVLKELGLGDEEVAAIYAVHACGSEEPIGYVDIEGLLGLRQALQRVLSVLGSNYSLVKAEYIPGLVVNDTLVKRPRWVLVLAKTYRGYRLWPHCCDAVAEVDALNGSVKLLQRGNYIEPKSPVLLPSQDKLLSMSPEQLVRRTLKQILSLHKGWGRQALEDILANRTRYDYSIDLRIARLGDESNVLLSAQRTVAKEFLGQPRLYWVITIEADHVRASALVDAVTGQLASYIVEPLWPRAPWAELLVKPIYPGKSINITRSIKGLGETTVTLVRVLSAEPGEKGTITLVVYWRTHANPAAIKTVPKIILEPKTIETKWIRLTPLSNTVVIKPGTEAKNRILYEYTVSTSANPGIYVAEIKLGEQAVSYQNTSRCIPLAMYIEK